VGTTVSFTAITENKHFLQLFGCTVMFTCVQREGRTAVQTHVMFSEQCAYNEKMNYYPNKN
jgi:hypothetical protein